MTFPYSAYFFNTIISNLILLAAFDWMIWTNLNLNNLLYLLNE